MQVKVDKNVKSTNFGFEKDMLFVPTFTNDYTAEAVKNTGGRVYFWYKYWW